jgi:hypothetical protein
MWQVGMWLQSLQDIGEDDKAHVLLYKPIGKKVSQGWIDLSVMYPKAKFAVFEENELNKLIGIYIPIIRPAILEKYFRQNPSLKDKAIFYCDCDVLFTRKPDVAKFLDDEICYLSDTNSYINSDYIIGKARDVLPEKVEAFKNEDVLQDMCDIVGISKDLPLKYNRDSGGAQYLLKNIDADFWKKVKDDCISLHVHLNNINKKYFASTDRGYQSWCADMWSVLYNIWLRGMDTKVVPEMRFAWSTDKKEILGVVSILHNAGITHESAISAWKEDENGKHVQVKAPAFYKGRYHTGKSPYKDVEYLQSILDNEITKQYCTHYYTEYLIKQKEKLCQIVEKN